MSVDMCACTITQINHVRITANCTQAPTSLAFYLLATLVCIKPLTKLAAPAAFGLGSQRECHPAWPYLSNPGTASIRNIDQ